MLAPVKQLIMDKLPKTARIHQQAKELISNLCMHFLMKLAEESNEFCSAQNKKTVCPDHVLDALTVIYHVYLVAFYLKPSLLWLPRSTISKASFSYF